MSIKMFITIDTEEDTWNEWTRTGNSVENIDLIPKLQELFDRFEAVPTYLVDYPVVTNDRAMRIIREIHDRGRCEIGTHCHPWNTPPFEEEINSHNSRLNNLSYELIFKKVETLHEEIKKRLGVIPKCFRAGRWGFGPNVARCIHELGYMIDTSITPLWDWSYEDGPDFYDAPIYPYRFNPDDILTDNPKGCILEVSPTFGFFQKNIKRCARVRKWILSSPLARFHVLEILDKLRLLNLRWLSPEYFDGSEMISLSENMIRVGYQSLNMMFHSNSLLPGKSEFVRNDNEIEDFLHNIELLLEFVVDNGLEFSALSGALHDFNRADDGSY